MCAQVQWLLPETSGLRWELLDTLVAEGLTSQNDWESHNLADLAALARQLAPKTFLPQEQIQAAAANCAAELMDHVSTDQLAPILTALISQLAQPATPTPQGPKEQLRRLKQRGRQGLGRLAGRLKRRLTSP